MADLVQNLGSFVPDNLIVDGSIPILTKAVKLEAEQGTLQRGTVLGKATKAIGEVVGPDGGGTIGEVVLGKAAKLGTYTLTCTTATAQGVPVLTKAVTLEAEQGTLQRGTVLGKATKAIGEVVGPDGGGTIGEVVLGKAAKLGTYTLTCTTATAQGVPAVFEVIDPDGIRLGDAVAGEAYTGPINFMITEAAGFTKGDVFIVPVVAGSGKYKKVDSTNVDGSQVADCILADNVDTALDVTAIAYKTGHFNRKALIVGDSDTVDMHEDKLRELGIFLSDNVPSVFEVIDPDGIRLGDAVAGEAYTGPINFMITEAAGFTKGDVFIVPVVAGSGKYKKVDSTNVDGSQVADCILADNVDTALDVTAIAYKTGHFNRKALIVGDSDTVDMHEDKLRELGIFLSDNVPY